MHDGGRLEQRLENMDMVLNSCHGFLHCMGADAVSSLAQASRYTYPSQDSSGDQLSTSLFLRRAEKSFHGFETSIAPATAMYAHWGHAICEETPCDHNMRVLLYCRKTRVVCDRAARLRFFASCFLHTLPQTPAKAEAMQPFRLLRLRNRLAQWGDGARRGGEE